MSYSALLTNIPLKVLDGKNDYINFCEAAAKFGPEMNRQLHNHEELIV